MAHIRTQIRAAFVAQLTDAGTAAGSRVWPSRPVKVPEDDMPSLHVSVLSETSERSGDCLPLERRPTIQVIGFVEADAAKAEDKGDALALEVEKAVAIDETMAGTLSDIVLTETNIEFERGKKVIAIVEMTFAAEAVPTALADM